MPLTDSVGAAAVNPRPSLWERNGAHFISGESHVATFSDTHTAQPQPGQPTVKKSEGMKRPAGYGSAASTQTAMASSVLGAKPSGHTVSFTSKRTAPY